MPPKKKHTPRMGPYELPPAPPSPANMAPEKSGLQKEGSRRRAPEGGLQIHPSSMASREKWESPEGELQEKEEESPEELCAPEGELQEQEEESPEELPEELPEEEEEEEDPADPENRNFACVANCGYMCHTDKSMGGFCCRSCAWWTKYCRCKQWAGDGGMEGWMDGGMEGCTDLK